MSNSYIIDNTSGTISFIVEPGTLDGPGGVNRNSDLYLYGQGSILWGEGIAENQLRLAESFACPQKEATDTGYIAGVPQPKTETDLGSVGLGITVPVDGQLWYNTTTKILYTYDLVDTTWKTSSGLSIDSEPTLPVKADLKYDSDYHGTGIPQLLVYDDELTPSPAFVSVAYEYVELAGTDTGTRVQPMTGLLTLSGDPVDNLHPVTKQFGETTYLDRDGSDTMTGALNMNTNLINNVVNPVDQQDAMTLNYAEATYSKISGGAPLSGDLDMGTNSIINMADPVNPQEAATLASVTTMVEAMFEALHPVGSIIISPTNPQTALALLGITQTWTSVSAGTFIQAAGDGSQGAAGSTGGANTKTLSEAEMPRHKHTFSGSALPSHDHNHEIGFGGGGTISRHSGQAATLFQGAIDTGSRSAGTPSGSISYAGSTTGWNSRPQYQVADMWKRTT